MKIITWNCNMAFRKKAELLLTLQPDIVIAVECECPEKLLFPSDTPKPTDCLWFGTNPHKGLAVLSYGACRFKKLKQHNAHFKIIVPVKVSGGPFDFNLFLVWAHHPDDKDGKYITQVWKAIHYYDKLLTGNPTMLVGDFNSNAIWDHEKNRLGSHSGVVAYLENKGIHSTYHVYHQQKKGEEQHPTFYLYRHQDKPYHLDYCFVSEDLLLRLHAVEIGDYATWTKYSDHVPLVVTFEDN